MENLLIQAILDEDVIAVTELLRQGANPNIFEDTDKIRPLHFVAQKDSVEALEIARLLMHAGADPLAQTEPDGQTPLEVAELMSSADMVAILSGVGAETRH